MSSLTACIGASLQRHCRSWRSVQHICKVISSTTGTHGNAGQLNYSAAKSAVLGMTKTVCKEWGELIFVLFLIFFLSLPIHVEGMFNIRCNAIAFGRIQTRLTAEKKGGAQLVLPTGDKVNLGIPGASQANFDAIPLRRAGTPEGVCVCVCV